MRLSTVLFILLAGASTVRSAEAQGAADPAAVVRPASLREATDLGLKLIGVFDDQTGEWLDQVVVRDTVGNETATSKIGVATLNALEPVAGVFLLELRKPGYQPQRVRLRADTSAQVLIALRRVASAATPLAPIVTTARSTLQSDAGMAEGFFNRCQLGAACVGPSDIERRPTAQLADLLAVVPGVHRNCTGTSGITSRSASRINGIVDVASCKITMTGINSSICTPYFFINGFLWVPATGQGDVQSQVDKAVDYSRVTGVEVYLTMESKPARFDPGGWVSCGSIVIWMR